MTIAIMMVATAAAATLTALVAMVTAAAATLTAMVAMVTMVTLAATVTVGDRPPGAPIRRIVSAIIAFSWTVGRITALR